MRTFLKVGAFFAFVMIFGQNSQAQKGVGQLDRFDLDRTISYNGVSVNLKTKVATNSGFFKYYYHYEVTNKSSSRLMFSWDVLNEVFGGLFTFELKPEVPVVFDLEHDDLPVWSKASVLTIQKESSVLDEVTME